MLNWPWLLNIHLLNTCWISRSFLTCFKFCHVLIMNVPKYVTFKFFCKKNYSRYVLRNKWNVMFERGVSNINIDVTLDNTQHGLNRSLEKFVERSWQVRSSWCSLGRNGWKEMEEREESCVSLCEENRAARIRIRGAAVVEGEGGGVGWEEREEMGAE